MAMRIRRIARPPVRRRRKAGAAAADGGAEPSIKSIAWEKLTWVNIEQPTEAETKYLADNYTFHTLDLDDCLSACGPPCPT